MTMRDLIHKSATVLKTAIDNGTVEDGLTMLPAKALEKMISDLEAFRVWCDTEQARLAPTMDAHERAMLDDAIDSLPIKRPQIVGALYYIARATNPIPTPVELSDLYNAMRTLCKALPPFIEFVRVAHSSAVLAGAHAEILYEWAKA